MSRSNWKGDKRLTTAAWQRTRERILERDMGMCQCERCKGQDLIAHEVDHIKPRAKGGTDDDSNLQAMNTDCHKRKTIEDSGRTFIAREAVGVNGIPRGWK
jgi:5-methylcytosine-specific restriction protein A